MGRTGPTNLRRGNRAMTIIEKDYDSHARGVAQSIGLKVAIARAPRQTCPAWKNPCDHRHGIRYLVTLTSTRGDRLTFPYWDSMHNQATGAKPTVYDVLACVSSNANMPTDPDEVVEDLGPMKPSQAIAVAKQVKKLRAFFTRAELERLSEVS